ncbi:MAG: hypothetical protein RLZZ01_1751 [Actinomycetota bacterium]
MPSITSSLALVPVYVGVQHLLGAHRPRHRAIELLDLGHDDVMIDIGCGPAYYFDRLPTGTTYFGFDTSSRYIAWSTARFGDRGSFTSAVFDEDAAASIPRPTAAALFGLLHHLPDDEADQLLRLIGRSLGAGGRAVSVDTCFFDGQGRVDAWLSARDRGEFVRRTERFEEMASSVFGSVETELLAATPRMPTSHWIMRMSDPVAG